MCAESLRPSEWQKSTTGRNHPGKQRCSKNYYVQIAAWRIYRKKAKNWDTADKEQRKGQQIYSTVISIENFQGILCLMVKLW